MTDQTLVLATGGTIASTGEERATPEKRGSELIAEVPALDGRVQVEQVAQRPSPDMQFTILDEVNRRIEAHAAETQKGIVVTHGTDTMAESAYYLDLHRDGGHPIIFTGAQRRPDEPGADGPANIVDAVTIAEESHAQAAGGVYICLNGEIHTARHAVKAHTWRPDSFISPNSGPVGAVGPVGIEWYREAGSETVTISPDEAPAGDVPIVMTGLGVDRTVVDRAIKTDCDGIVIQATGLGNTPEPVAEAVKNAVNDGIPVVITSRCQAGGVAPVYGAGGGQTLQEHGAVFAGDLPASKARIKLLLALEADRSISDTFAR